MSLAVSIPLRHTAPGLPGSRQVLASRSLPELEGQGGLAGAPCRGAGAERAVAPAGSHAGGSLGPALGRPQPDPKVPPGRGVLLLLHAQRSSPRPWSSDPVNPLAALAS